MKMDDMQTYFIIAFAVLAIGLIIVILRNPGIFKKIIGSAAVGLVALTAVNLTAAFTGVSLAFSVWSIMAAGLLGLPGVVSMLLVKIFWKV